MIYYRIRPPSSEPLQTFKIRHFPSLRVFIPYQKAPFTAIGKWRSSYPVLTFDLYSHILLKKSNKKSPKRASLRCIWWLRPELNRRHMDFQSIALPTELPSQKMAVPTGLEPAISCVTGRHVNHYTTGPCGCGGKI